MLRKSDFPLDYFADLETLNYGAQQRLSRQASASFCATWRIHLMGVLIWHFHPSTASASWHQTPGRPTKLKQKPTKLSFWAAQVAQWFSTAFSPGHDPGSPGSHPRLQAVPNRCATGTAPGLPILCGPFHMISALIKKILNLIIIDKKDCWLWRGDSSHVF